LGGDDSVDASAVSANVTLLTLDGGTGNDTIDGSQGADQLFGDDGNDFIDGHQGNDVASLGAGDDTFQWNPGDGSDTVEGGDGSDNLIFVGANIAETMDISANGTHVRFFRNPGNVTMDLHGVEDIDVFALGGPDTITVNDLSGTDVTAVNLDLDSAQQSGAGDGEID